MAALAAVADVKEEEMAAATQKAKRPGIGTATAAAAKPKPKAAAAEKKNGAPRVTAAARFRELIMKGGQTDDQIFVAVQREFKLDPKQRSYVAWYRRDLEKKGKHPPKAKA
jgi:hypothetical protein